MEYYVRECGNILGVTSKLPAESQSAKHVLEYVFAQVVEFKKLNQVNKKLCAFYLTKDLQAFAILFYFYNELFILFLI